jgi:hypothetical protein
MKPDGMLVEPEHISTAGQQVVGEGAGKALDNLAASEPALAGYVSHRLAALAGSLALNGAPTEVVQATHEEMLTIVLVSLAALRRGHFELWKDTLDAAARARLQVDPPEPTRTRRKKRGGEAGSK